MPRKKEEGGGLKYTQPYSWISTLICGSILEYLLSTRHTHIHLNGLIICYLSPPEFLFLCWNTSPPNHMIVISFLFYIRPNNLDGHTIIHCTLIISNPLYIQFWILLLSLQPFVYPSDWVLVHSILTYLLCLKLSIFVFHYPLLLKMKLFLAL